MKKISKPDQNSPPVSTPGFRTAADAEEAFYAAFEARDLGMLASVWSEDAHVYCILPLGSPIQGHSQILAAFDFLFEAAPTISVTVSNHNRIESGTLCVHHVVEHVYAVDNDARFELHATNVFQLETDGWRLIGHHASPASGDEPAAPILH